MAVVTWALSRPQKRCELCRRPEEHDESRRMLRSVHECARCKRQLCFGCFMSHAGGLHAND